MTSNVVSTALGVKEKPCMSVTTVDVSYVTTQTATGGDGTLH